MVRTLPFHGKNAGSSPVGNIYFYMINSFVVLFSTDFFFTPLEQFDEVAWLTHRVVETVEPYVLFISEREFDARQRYTNTFGASSSSISYSTLYLNESQV